MAAIVDSEVILKQRDSIKVRSLVNHLTTKSKVGGDQGQLSGSSITSSIRSYEDGPENEYREKISSEDIAISNSHHYGDVETKKSHSTLNGRLAINSTAHPVTPERSPVSSPTGANGTPSSSIDDHANLYYYNDGNVSVHPHIFSNFNCVSESPDSHDTNPNGVHEDDVFEDDVLSHGAYDSDFLSQSGYYASRDNSAGGTTPASSRSQVSRTFFDFKHDHNAFHDVKNENNSRNMHACAHGIKIQTTDASLASVSSPGMTNTRRRIRLQIQNARRRAALVNEFRKLLGWKEKKEELGDDHAAKKESSNSTDLNRIDHRHHNFAEEIDESAAQDSVPKIILRKVRDEEDLSTIYGSRYNDDEECSSTVINNSSKHKIDWDGGEDTAIEDNFDIIQERRRSNDKTHVREIDRSEVFFWVVIILAVITLMILGIIVAVRK